ncbi:MAG: SIR2 family NAD-dependent protein deacylase [Vulcanimicrobiaceae bacterium]
MIDEIARRLQLARSVFVLTGSGISAESGLPTFRGAGGLWNTHRVEQLASPEGFARDPRLVWTWYNERRAAHTHAEPSPAHRVLARLESNFDDFTLATQNVDSLHRRAGSRNVLELHGSLREAHCNRCGEVLSIEDGLPVERIEHACGGLFRPGVVWFGEALPVREWSLAAEAAQRADVKLVIGTSAVVHPAASLAFGNDAYLVEINPADTTISDRVDASLRMRASDALTEIESRFTAEV